MNKAIPILIALLLLGTICVIADGFHPSKQFTANTVYLIEMTPQPDGFAGVFLDMSNVLSIFATDNYGNVTYGPVPFAGMGGEVLYQNEAGNHQLKIRNTSWGYAVWHLESTFDGYDRLATWSFLPDLTVVDQDNALYFEDSSYRFNRVHNFDIERIPGTPDHFALLFTSDADNQLDPIDALFFTVLNHSAPGIDVNEIAFCNETPGSGFAPGECQQFFWNHEDCVAQAPDCEWFEYREMLDITFPVMGSQWTYDKLNLERLDDGTYVATVNKDAEQYPPLAWSYQIASDGTKLSETPLGEDSEPGRYEGGLAKFGNTGYLARVDAIDRPGYGRDWAVQLLDSDGSEYGDWPIWPIITNSEDWTNPDIIMDTVADIIPISDNKMALWAADSNFGFGWLFIYDLIGTTITKTANYTTLSGAGNYFDATIAWKPGFYALAYGGQFITVYEESLAECSIDTDCASCQKCDTGNCVNQSTSEDTKDECSATDCYTGNCDGAGACDIYSGGEQGGCGTCEYCTDGDSDCELVPDDTDPNDECTASYDACINDYTLQGPDGYCDGAGACDTDDATANVSEGNVCITGSDTNPTNTTYCDKLANCVSTYTSARYYYLGYLGDGTNTCSETGWQTLNETWDATIGFKISTTEHAPVCQEERIFAGGGGGDKLPTEEPEERPPILGVVPISGPTKIKFIDDIIKAIKEFFEKIPGWTGGGF